ncbi:MAG: alpha/beta hydrolase [Parachlamydiaceae bacterium]|nr:alpha/beta hydrolase [Parachlamydiaceae bacterium]
MAKWTTKTCEVNGIDVHYLRTGGDKPAIVLLHGLMLNGRCWAPLARALEEDYDVIMPDARGHGNSSAPEEGYCYNNLAVEVMGLCEALGLTSPVLLGHSMGGMTAAVVASQNPKHLRGLILVDPAFLTAQRQREVNKSDVASQHRHTLNLSKDEFLAESRIRHSRRSSELIELFVQARFQTSIHAFEILKSPNPDYVQLINNLHIPSLLVVGDVDAIVSPEMIRELVEINQRLKVAKIAEAGHAVCYDQPEIFSVIVKKFLRSLSN